MPTNGDLSLYIHVPFCTKKCDYCHFFVVPNKSSLKTDWFLSLKKEWQLIQPQLEGYRILTLYFGGGTPSLLPPEWIAEIISWVKDKPQEITLEVNPDDATFGTLQQFYQAGVNRISVGIQTFHEEQLLALGRLHTSDKAKQTLLDAHAAGLRNISADLMYDLPNQTLEDWERNLEEVVRLPVTHLSLYNLTIEPNTSFYRRREKLQPLLPGDVLSKEMLLAALSRLKDAGFEHYEISAFCRNGLISLHNIGYWLGRPFLGLGPAAFSYYAGKRTQNAPSISQYKNMLKSGTLPITFEEKLEPDARQREHFVIQLRLLEGVKLPRFEAVYGALDHQMREQLLSFAQMGWIESPLTHPRLTQEGLFFYDTIAEELI